MQEMVWLEEEVRAIYRSSEKNEEEKTSSSVRSRAALRVEKTLMNGSDPVMASNGFFIYQKNGTAHIIYKKLIRVEEKYFNPLCRYLREHDGAITLSAKQAFESGDMQVIKKFLNSHHF